MPFSAFSSRGFRDVYLFLLGAGTDEEHWRCQSRSLQQDHCPGSHINLFIPVQKSVFQLIKNPFEGAWPDSLLPRALHGPPRYPCHCHTGSTGRTDEHGGVCEELENPKIPNANLNFDEKCSLQGCNPHDHVSTS